MKDDEKTNPRQKNPPEELTLDPEDWGAFRAFVHQALDGVFCLRTAIVNHRSRREDFKLLAAAVADIGAEFNLKNSKDC